jgi:Tfp pilus assembly protein PilF
MMRHSIFIFLLCVSLLLAGCANFIEKLSRTGDRISQKTNAIFYGDSAKPETDTRDMTQAEAALAKGIMAYDDANYPVAATYLNNALELHLYAKSSQIKAHKYLAFIHCASSRENLCRSEFRKVLEIDPGYELEPAEAGHPIWGPIFRSEKAEMAPRGIR